MLVGKLFILIFEGTPEKNYVDRFMEIVVMIVHLASGGNNCMFF